MRGWSPILLLTAIDDGFSSLLLVRDAVGMIGDLSHWRSSPNVGVEMIVQPADVYNINEDKDVCQGKEEAE